jgi:hypothetical protein
MTVHAGVAALIACLIGSLCHAQEDGSIPTFGVTVVDSLGMQGQIYLIPPGSQKLPNFRKLKSKGSIYASRLNIPARDFTEGFPGVTDRFEWFAIDYNGRFWISTPGEYQFSLLSDDGSKLYIDNKVVIRNDGIHPAKAVVGSVRLTGDVHTIRVSYFQGPRMEVALILKIRGPDEKRFAVFDTHQFRPPQTLEK